MNNILLSGCMNNVMNSLSQFNKKSDRSDQSAQSAQSAQGSRLFDSGPYEERLPEDQNLPYTHSQIFSELVKNLEEDTISQTLIIPGAFSGDGINSVELNILITKINQCKNGINNRKLYDKNPNVDLERMKCQLLQHSTEIEKNA